MYCRADSCVNPMPGKKLRKNLASFAEGYYALADGLFERCLVSSQKEAQTDKLNCKIAKNTTWTRLKYYDR